MSYFNLYLSESYIFNISTSTLFLLFSSSFFFFLASCFLSILFHPSSPDAWHPKFKWVSLACMLHDNDDHDELFFFTGWRTWLRIPLHFYPSIFITLSPRRFGTGPHCSPSPWVCTVCACRCAGRNQCQRIKSRRRHPGHRKEWQLDRGRGPRRGQIWGLSVPRPRACWAGRQRPVGAIWSWVPRVRPGPAAAHPEPQHDEGDHEPARHPEPDEQPRLDAEPDHGQSPDAGDHRPEPRSGPHPERPQHPPADAGGREEPRADEGDDAEHRPRHEQHRVVPRRFQHAPPNVRDRPRTLLERDHYGGWGWSCRWVEPLRRPPWRRPEQRQSHWPVGHRRDQQRVSCPKHQPAP